jgi:hypothetical protein
MTSVAPPICGGCKNLTSPDLREPRCTAFPDGIPNEILLSRADHRQPFAGDNGIRFDPKDADAAKYAEFIFEPVRAGE